MAEESKRPMQQLRSIKIRLWWVARSKRIGSRIEHSGLRQQVWLLGLRGGIRTSKEIAFRAVEDMIRRITIRIEWRDHPSWAVIMHRDGD
jgi:hypothetical protein